MTIAEESNDLATFGAMSGSPKEAARALANIEARHVMVMTMDEMMGSNPAALRSGSALLIVKAVTAHFLRVNASRIAQMTRESSPGHVNDGVDQASAKTEAYLKLNHANITSALESCLMLVESTLETNQTQMNTILSLLVPREVPPPCKMLEAIMLSKAKANVIASGDWITADEIAKLARLSGKNPSAQPNKWKKENAIFAIPHNGTYYFPFYGLDPDRDYRPFKPLREIVAVLGPKFNAWGLAFWFSSINGFLDDQRPQDMIATDANKVIAAAREEVVGVLHG